jgi:hypothetical protein
MRCLTLAFTTGLLVTSSGAAQQPVMHTSDFFVACTTVAALRHAIELTGEDNEDAFDAYVDGNHGCFTLQGGHPAYVEKSFHVDGIAFNVIKFRTEGVEASLYAMSGAVQ